MYRIYTPRLTPAPVSIKQISPSEAPRSGKCVASFEAARNVVIWPGPDNEAGHVSVVLDAIRQIADILCKELKISYDELKTHKNIYPELTFAYRNTLPAPDQCGFITQNMWDSLRWLYSHSYFSRIWVIQEVNANTNRIVHCGHELIDWVPVEFVAGYIIFDTAFSQDHGFSDKYCWWASTTPTELRQAERWLHMLYLVSNYDATDPQHVIYGVRCMMKVRKGGHILDPDYSKTTTEVYRDSAEASFVDYEKTDALLYVHGLEDPSWVPRWDQAMLFRDPFRFGKPVPWTPAGNSVASTYIEIMRHSCVPRFRV